VGLIGPTSPLSGEALQHSRSNAARRPQPIAVYGATNGKAEATRLGVRFGFECTRKSLGGNLPVLSCVPSWARSWRAAGGVLGLVMETAPKIRLRFILAEWKLNKYVKRLCGFFWSSARSFYCASMGSLPVRLSPPCGAAWLGQSCHAWQQRDSNSEPYFLQQAIHRRAQRSAVAVATKTGRRTEDFDSSLHLRKTRNAKSVSGYGLQDPGLFTSLLNQMNRFPSRSGPNVLLVLNNRRDLSNSFAMFERIVRMPSAERAPPPTTSRARR
jgi:hypothetical protein